jgi:hypothetical protein
VARLARRIFEMTKADRAEVRWDLQKKRWLVRIQVGEEVIKRPAPAHKPARDAAEQALRALAIETAHNDGYELDPAAVTILR